MKKSLNYAAMFTLRADGLYMGYWRELDRNGKPSGKRHAIYDRDPERLFQRIQEKQKPKQKTLRVAAEEWEAIHREEVAVRTWQNYAPHVEDIIQQYGDLPVAEITSFDVSQDLLATKAKGYSHTVVNSRRSIWNGIMDYAISQRDIPFNPAASVKLPKGLKKGKRSAPPEDIISEIIRNAYDTDFGFIPFFLLCTGVRRSEALHRKVSDLDTANWELNIPTSKTQAGIRAVPIIVPLREPLKQWIDAHPGEWLFPYISYNKRSGTYMTDSNWDTAWLKYCSDHGWLDEDGRPVIGAHNLRHATATLLYEAGVDIYTAQHILGHANVSTTLEIYTDLRKNHEKKNIGKFSRSISKLQTSAKKQTTSKK